MRQVIVAASLSFSLCVTMLAVTGCGQISNLIAQTSASNGSAATTGNIDQGDNGPRMISYSQSRVEHLATWTEVGGARYNPPNNDWSDAAKIIDWGITIQGPKAAQTTIALNKAGIISVYYTDPNRQKVGGPEYTNDESTFAHDCANNRILIT